MRDVFFQLAFAGYVGAVFNLNPFLERDGYHMLVDHLGEPGLRRRAREQFKRRLAGRRDESDSPVLARYSLWGLVWGFVLPAIVIGVSLRYIPIFTGLVSPDGVVLRRHGDPLGGVLRARPGGRSIPPLVERIRGRD